VSPATPGEQSVCSARQLSGPACGSGHFRQWGCDPPRGAAPQSAGVCKEMLARANTSVVDVAFPSLEPADVNMTLYIGNAEATVRRAQPAVLCVLFFEEIDVIVNGVTGAAGATAAIGGVMVWDAAWQRRCRDVE
jgi:hypothetical protein